MTFEDCYIVFSPADLHVTDPLGRYTGLNLSSGFVLLGVPGFYSGPDSEPEYIVVPNPVSGQYLVELNSTSSTPANYSLSIVRVINETVVYQIELTNATINPGEMQSVQMVPDMASLQKSFKPEQIHQDRHGGVKATTTTVTNIGQVTTTKLELVDELLPNFTIKDLETVSVILINKNGRKLELEKKAMGRPMIADGKLYLTIDFSKTKKTHELMPGKSLIIKYKMHPTIKKLIAGEYATETSAKVTSKEGPFQSLTTVSKFSIIAKEHEDKEEKEIDDDHDDEKD